MSRSRVLTLAALMALGVPLSAQVVVPAAYARAESRSQSYLPLGSGTRVRVQFLYERGIVPARMNIGQIALRGNGGLKHPGAKAVDLEIAMSSSPASPWKMNALFAANRGTDFATVFRRRKVDLPALAGGPAPAPFSIRFALDRSFRMQATGNLLVEWILHDGTPARNYNVDAAGFDGARNTYTGRSCGAGPQFVQATVQGPSSTARYSLTAGSSRARGIAVQLLGTRLLPTPMPLWFKPCVLYQDLVLLVVAPLDTQGRVTVSYRLPTWAKGIGIQSQFLVASAELQNWGASESVRTVIGGVDAVNTSYSRSFTHSSGVVGRGGGVIMELR